MTYYTGVLGNLGRVTEFSFGMAKRTGSASNTLHMYDMKQQYSKLFNEHVKHIQRETG